MNANSLFTKKKALTTVFITALILAAIIMLRWYSSDDRLMTTEDREKFLLELGWEIDIGSECYKSVLLPDKLEGIMEEYNTMQMQQGFDLNKYLGEECDQFSYTLLNYPESSATVLVTLYIHNGKLIAADIHSTALDGFMHGIYRK